MPEVPLRKDHEFEPGLSISGDISFSEQISKALCFSLSFLFSKLSSDANKTEWIGSGRVFFFDKIFPHSLWINLGIIRLSRRLIFRLPSLLFVPDKPDSWRDLVEFSMRSLIDSADFEDFCSRMEAMEASDPSQRHFSLRHWFSRFKLNSNFN